MTEQLDSTIAWVADHTKTYVESGGTEGHMWKGRDGSLAEGVPCLVLFTKGRKSAATRRNALIYIEEGDDHLIVASRGGDASHPHWYLNLVDDPNVQIQVGQDTFDVTAVTLTSQEKADAWESCVAVWPPYADYQAKTDRDIPVVRLRRS